MGTLGDDEIHLDINGIGQLVGSVQETRQMMKILGVSVAKR